MNISDWIKANSSVSSVAADLNVSRPTVYKYIEKYDAGEHDKIPETVLSYFEQKLTNRDNQQSNEIKISLNKEIAVIESKLELETVHMKELMNQQDQLADRMDKLKHDLEDNYGDPEIRKQLLAIQVRHKVITEESLICSETVKRLESILIEKQRILAEYEHTESLPAKTTDVFKIKSSCFIENGRCMVVHTGEESAEFSYGSTEEGVVEPVYYRLHLYSKIGNEFAHLGEYKPVKNRNFFIIEDVFLSAPLYYNIVTCVVDPQFDGYDLLEGDEEPPLIELSGADCTGICELKQRR